MVTEEEEEESDDKHATPLHARACEEGTRPGMSCAHRHARAHCLQYQQNPHGKYHERRDATDEQRTTDKRQECAWRG
eukprot:1194060-Pyramimonas_sp.AAC.1